jgi:integrase
MLDDEPSPVVQMEGAQGVWRDRSRSVVNPVQARTLLAAVAETRRSGPRLVAFFGLMYFSAMRPEEAANVHKYNLSIPREGWGEIHIDEATPHAGAEWTNDGRQRERRQLKNRARGQSRTVPCAPELTALLQQHLAAFGTAPDGRLFVGERATELPKLTYMRAWRAARRARRPTPSATRACRRGSTGASRRRRSPSGPATRWRCC